MTVNIQPHFMKTRVLLPAMLATVLAAQAQPAPVSSPLPPRQVNPVTPAAAPARYGAGGAAPRSDDLTRFDLDFPGGTPQQLVAAIQKAMGRPLNAIIPEDVADTRLPALKMNSVSAQQLFQALEQAVSSPSPTRPAATTFKLPKPATGSVPERAVSPTILSGIFMLNGPPCLQPCRQTKFAGSTLSLLILIAAS